MSSLWRRELKSCIVEIGKSARCREELQNGKWPHVRGEVAMREMLTGEKATELRDLGTLACWMKCERESWLKKTLNEVGRTRIVCVWNL